MFTQVRAGGWARDPLSCGPIWDFKATRAQSSRWGRGFLAAAACVALCAVLAPTSALLSAYCVLRGFAYTIAQLTATSEAGVP